MTTVFHKSLHGRFLEIKSYLRRQKLHKTNQGSNFIGGSFSNRDNVRAPIQFRRERKSQHLKQRFFFKKRPIYFQINSTRINRTVKWNQLSFLSKENIKPILAPVYSAWHRSDSSSEANSNCCHKTNTWSHLE